jgi:hypothetical protein
LVVTIEGDEPDDQSEEEALTNTNEPKPIPTNASQRAERLKDQIEKLVQASSLRKQQQEKIKQTLTG